MQRAGTRRGFFDQENKGLVYVRDQRNFDRNLSQKRLVKVNIFEQAEHFQRRGLNPDCMFLNVNSFRFQKRTSGGMALERRRLPHSRAVRSGISSKHQTELRSPIAVVRKICIRHGPSEW